MTRRSSRIRLIAWCAVASVIGANSRDARACSCEQPPPPQEALANADAVFSGRVISVESADTTDLVRLRVQDAWKGVEREEVVIRSGPGNCAIYFVLDHDYLVYAYDDDGELVTNMCTRTARLQDAAGDVSALGPPLDIQLKSTVSPVRYVLCAVLVATLLVVVRAAWRMSPRKR